MVAFLLLLSWEFDLPAFRQGRAMAGINRDGWTTPKISEKLPA